MKQKETEENIFLEKVSFYIDELKASLEKSSEITETFCKYLLDNIDIEKKLNAYELVKKISCDFNSIEQLNYQLSDDYKMIKTNLHKLKSVN